MKDFPLTICNIPEKHLYDGRENPQMYAIAKLGWSSHYDSFEANFKSAV